MFFLDWSVGLLDSISNNTSLPKILTFKIFTFFMSIFSIDESIFFFDKSTYRTLCKYTTNKKK